MQAMKPFSAYAASLTGRLSTHGGDLAAARSLFPAAPEPWIDLSTGINPHAYPLPALPAACFARLPEPADLGALEALGARAFGVMDAACVVAAAGSQAIIQMLPHVFLARRVAVLGHSYGGHAAVWAGLGREVSVVEDYGQLQDFDVAVIVNPNNPDGRTISLRMLTLLANTMAAQDGLLVVDEAFVEASAGSRTFAPFVPPSGALVLRSFGKFHGLAGLRLGFAVAPPAFAAQLRGALGPWPVSGPAIAVAARALADTAWTVATQERLAADTLRLDRLLRLAGFSIVGGTPLFRLARHSAAAEWFARLGAAGILTRPFRDRPDWLRLGLPGPDEAWARLAAALGVEG